MPVEMESTWSAPRIPALGVFGAEKTQRQIHDCIDLNAAAVSIVPVMPVFFSLTVVNFKKKLVGMSFAKVVGSPEPFGG